MFRKFAIKRNYYFSFTNNKLIFIIFIHGFWKDFIFHTVVKKKESNC